MKKILLISCIALLSLGFTLPQQPDDLRIRIMIVQFDENGNVEDFELRGEWVKNGSVIGTGSRNYLNQLPSAHKTQYETYLGLYENAIKTQVGL